MRYAPLSDRVIIRQAKDDEATKSGLVIPATAQSQKHVAYGEVIAVGPGRRNTLGELIPPMLELGQIVCYPRKAVALIPIINSDGTEEHVVLMQEANIIAVVHDMPQPTLITDVTGQSFDARILQMSPSSRAMPDVAEENREGLDRAEKDWGIDTSDHVDQPNDHTG